MVDNNEPAPDGIEVPPSLPLGAAVEGVEVPPSTTYRVPPTSLESEPENVQQQPEQAVKTAVFGTNATMQQGQEATKNDGLQLESGTGKGTIEGRWTMVLLLAVLAAAFGSSFQFGYHIGAINVPADQIKLFIYTSHLSSKYESKFVDELINKLITNATTEADEINNRAENKAKGKEVTMQEQLMNEENGTLVRIASESGLNINLMWGFVISAFPLGAMITALTVGFVADLLGRKWAMLLNNAFAVIAAALMFMAPQPEIYNYWYLIAGRFVIGLNAGFNSGLAPMYLMEISPANLRGTIGSFAQLFVTIAILVAQCMGLPVLLGNLDLKSRSELLATERETPRFPFIFALSIVPVLVQLCTLPFCPESPKFTLIVRGRKEQAEEDLKKLRGQDDVSAELDLINEEAIATQSQAKVTPLDMFGPDLRWPLLLAVFTMVAQQLSGINAVMFFSTSIFKSAGLKDNMPYYATIGVGTVNVLMTVVSVYFIERLGRRLLFIGGMVGMFFFTALVAICMIIVKEAEIAWVAYFSVLFVYLFIISFASGPGSIPWFYVSELFPSNARGHANSFVVLTNWFLTFVVGIGFGHLQKLLKEYSFFLFTAMLGLFIAFAFFFLPETKGKTLEEARAEMNRRRGVADTTKTAEETS